MSDRPYSKDSIIAWISTTEEGRQAYERFSDDGQTVEDFLSDEVYVEKFLGLFASSIGYPGDGNWQPSVTPAP